MQYAIIFGLVGLAAAAPSPQGWEGYSSGGSSPSGGGWTSGTLQPVPETTTPAQTWTQWTTPAMPTTTTPCTMTTTMSQGWESWSTPVESTTTASQGWESWSTPVMSTTTAPCPMSQATSGWDTYGTPVVPTTSTDQGWGSWSSSAVSIAMTTAAGSSWSVYTSQTPVLSTWQSWATMSPSSNISTIAPVPTPAISSFSGFAAPTAMPQALGAGLAIIAAALAL